MLRAMRSELPWSRRSPPMERRVQKLMIRRSVSTITTSPPTDSRHGKFATGSPSVRIRSPETVRHSAASCWSQLVQGQTSVHSWAQEDGAKKARKTQSARATAVAILMVEDPVMELEPSSSESGWDPKTHQDCHHPADPKTIIVKFGEPNGLWGEDLGRSWMM